MIVVPLLAGLMLQASAAPMAGAPADQPPVVEGPAAATPDGLVGFAEADVRTRLGEPDVARREAQGAMWTYRRTDCSVFVFFQQRTDGLRVSSLSAGPRREGAASPSLDVCLAAPPAS